MLVLPPNPVVQFGHPNARLAAKSPSPPSKKQRLDGDKGKQAAALKSSAAGPRKLQWVGGDKLTVPTDHSRQCFSGLTQFLGAITSSPPAKISSSLDALYAAVRDEVVIYGKGQALYERIDAELRRAVGGLGRRLEAVGDGEQAFLEELVKAWEEFGRWMTAIRSVFLVLDRSFAYQTDKVLPLRELGEKLFRDIIFGKDTIASRTVTSILTLIQNSRSTSTSPSAALTSRTTSILSSLSLYGALLEQPLLQASAQFYSSEGEQKLQKLEPKAYLRHAETRIAEEAERVDAHLGGLNKVEIVGAVEEALVGARIGGIAKRSLDVLAQLHLPAKDVEVKAKAKTLKDLTDVAVLDLAGLKTLYALAKGAQVLPALRNALSERVKTLVKETVANPENDDSMVQSLMALRRQLEFELVGEAFEDDRRARSDIKDAFASGLLGRSNKPAEMIAKYLDFLMQSKVPADELSEVLVEVLELFRVVKDKDMFVAFYTLGLARRLVRGTVSSTDAEKEMLARLSEAAGEDFTKKCQQMLKDVSTSEELMYQFKASSFGKGTKLDRATIAMAAIWPFKGARLSLTTKTVDDTDGHTVAKGAALDRVVLPSEMAQDLANYEAFYKSRHKNRLLTWNHLLGEARLSAYLSDSGKPIEITAPLPAALILVLFARTQAAAKLSFAEIQENTGLPDAELLRALASLMGKRTPFLLKSGQGKNASFKLNTAFQPSKNVRVPVTKSAAEEADESKETAAEVENARMYALQAAAVRVLKARKKIAFPELVNEVVADVVRRNLTVANEKSLVSQIKKTIEGLIEKEYCERIEGERGMLSYIA